MDTHTRIDNALTAIQSLPSTFFTAGELFTVSNILNHRERYADQEFTANTLEEILASARLGPMLKWKPRT